MDDAKKRGRPVKSISKNAVVAMRINDNTARKLDTICEKHHLSKGEMLEKWVDYTYKMIENGIDFL